MAADAASSEIDPKADIAFARLGWTTGQIVCSQLQPAVGSLLRVCFKLLQHSSWGLDRTRGDGGERKVRAYYQAGHAVVALALGYRCYSLALEDGGEAVCDEPAEHALALLIASFITEAKCTGETDIWRDEADGVRAADLALWITRGDIATASALLSTVTAQTTARIKGHWSQIETIANALAEKGRLSGEEILSLVEKE